MSVSWGVCWFAPAWHGQESRCKDHESVRINIGMTNKCPLEEDGVGMGGCRLTSCHSSTYHYGVLCSMAKKRGRMALQWPNPGGRSH